MDRICNPTDDSGKRLMLAYLITQGRFTTFRCAKIALFGELDGDPALVPAMMKMEENKMLILIPFKEATRIVNQEGYTQKRIRIQPMHPEELPGMISKILTMLVKSLSTGNGRGVFRKQLREMESLINNNQIMVLMDNFILNPATNNEASQATVHK